MCVHALVCLSFPMHRPVFDLSDLKKHKCLCILWPSILRSIKHSESLLPLALLLGPSLFPRTDACHMPSLSFFFCGSRLSYEAVLIMFHLHSPPSVFVCVPYWYSSLFRFPLEKLASFDGPGEKTTKRQALTFLLFRSPYLFCSPPTLCFYLRVLSSSYSISLSKFLSYSFFSCWILLSFLMGIKKSSSYASVYSDQVEYTHRHTQLKHLPSIT